MYPRKYSLNKPGYVLKYGETADSNLLILKYLRTFPINIKNQNPRTQLVSEVFEQEAFPKFCIIISNKFAKKSSVKNRVKRAIAEGISKSLEADYKGWYVFIPKRRILDNNDKITVDVEKISTEAYTLLSKVALV